MGVSRSLSLPLTLGVLGTTSRNSSRLESLLADTPRMTKKNLSERVTESMLPLLLETLLETLSRIPLDHPLTSSSNFLLSALSSLALLLLPMEDLLLVSNDQVSQLA